LSPSEKHLTAIGVRASIIEARASLVKAAREICNEAGMQLPKSDTDEMEIEHLRALPVGLQEALKPLVESVEKMTKMVKGCDAGLDQMARDENPGE
jgi:hypothetical protein